MHGLLEVRENAILVVKVVFERYWVRVTSSDHVTLSADSSLAHLAPSLAISLRRLASDTCLIYQPRHLATQPQQLSEFQHPPPPPTRSWPTMTAPPPVNFGEELKVAFPPVR